MKPKDLRIGNYIKGIYETEIDRGNAIIEDVEIDEVVRVVVIDSVGISDYSIWIEDGTREEYDSFEPIPLTEEWLLKFGWGRGEYDYEYEYADNVSLKNAVLLYDYKNQVFTLELSSDQLEIKLYHVHQLQNLYFALTNEELETKIL